MNQLVTDYATNVANNICHIIPPEKMHLYHIIMGSQILGSYTNQKDMNDAVKTQFKYICCLKYIPLHYFCKKIQTCWRRHKSRGG